MYFATALSTGLCSRLETTTNTGMGLAISVWELESDLKNSCFSYPQSKLILVAR